MATKRTPISRTPVGKMSDVLRRYLLTGEYAGPDDENALDPFLFGERDWPKVRDEIVAEWIRENSGTRPHGWWKFDAKEDMRKVSGSGEDMTSRDCIQIMDCDPKDPPCVESEAAYLRRLGLLTAEEKRRLRPAAFRPVMLEVDEDGWGRVA